MDTQEQEFEEIELTTLHNSTIEWHADRADVNFTDRQIMETLDKLLFNGVHQNDILSHLEKLL
jgi:hypothetical protein